jgi:integrase
VAPKFRTKDRHLPAGVFYKNGAYHKVFRILVGQELVGGKLKNNYKQKWLRLGKTLEEMYISLSKLEADNFNMANLNGIFDRYLKEVASAKAPASYRANRIQMSFLKATFGHMSPNDITPVHIYKYLDVRGKVAKIAANREKSLLSHVYTKMIEWGVAKDNPCRNVKRITEKPRDRYIEDWEFEAVKNNSPALIKNCMEFCYLTGLRKGDMLKIKLTDLADEGIKIKTSKTRHKMIIEWSERLRDCVTNMRALERTIKGLYLVCNHQGQPYTASGFSTLWKRAIKDALAKGLIKERFRFHDIRRKAATDAERAGGRETARQLLGHKHQTTTAIYISGEQKVKPLK